MACIGYGYLFNQRKILHLRTVPDGSQLTTRQELLDCMMDASFLKFQIKSLGIVKLPKVYMKLKGRVVPFSRRASNLTTTREDNSNSSNETTKSSATMAVVKKSHGSVSISPWAVELADGTKIQVFDAEFADLDIRQVKEHEHILNTNEEVLILGLVQMEPDGTLRISRPSFSWQWFFISLREERVLLKIFRMYWRLWVSTGVAFEVIAVILLFALRRSTIK